MAKTQAISNEVVAAAVLSHRTLKEAAAAVGLSERALYDRMGDGEFLEIYRTAKTELIRATVLDINAKLQAAIETIADIMQKDSVNPAIRLQAAQAILTHAGRFAQRLESEEDSARKQMESNHKWIW